MIAKSIGFMLLILVAAGLFMWAILRAADKLVAWFFRLKDDEKEIKK